MSDLINRQDAIDATWFEPSYTDPLNVLTEVRDRIEKLPSAQPKRGRWIEASTDGAVFCSECGTEWLSEAARYYNFCPYCGARME